MDAFVIVGLALVTGLVIGMLIGCAMRDAEVEAQVPVARVVYMIPLLLPKNTGCGNEREQYVEIKEQELLKHHSN